LRPWRISSPRGGPAWVELQPAAALANGDGLTYLHKRQVVGLQANRAEPAGPGHWRVWPNEALRDLPGLTPGISLSRNRDHAWEQALNRKSAERKIELRGRLHDTPAGLAFGRTDRDGI
jgi:putative protease